MHNEIQFGSHVIGPTHPPFVICELSGNHNGSIDRALALIDEAAKTGCDAIKIQTYTPDTLTLASDGPDFLIQGGLWDGRSLHDLYQEAHTPFEWHEALFKRARRHSITLFSTPFDASAVTLLEELDVPGYKIASFEITDHELIKCVANTGKPLIISTGLANAVEIQEAVDVVTATGNKSLILLHCVSSYPAPDDSSNITTIPEMRDRFGCIVGLSDHTAGSAVSVAAVALGACAIEKHFTLARADGGPDAAFSLEPAEFGTLVRDCRSAWRALGEPSYNLKSVEEQNVVFRRSIYSSRNIAAGEILTRENVKVVRPGHGLAPKHLTEALGCPAKKDIAFATAITWDLFERKTG
jgi:pseudaminic acid synthase